MSQASGRNLAGNRLDQIARFAGDHRLDLVGDVRIAHGVCEIVARGLERQLEDDVNDERLAVAALFREDAVVAGRCQSGERYAVDRRLPSGIDSTLAHHPPRGRTRLGSFTESWSRSRRK